MAYSKGCVLYAQAVELYHARELVIELGRSVVPSFDLPLIQSNAEHLEGMRQAKEDLAEFEAKGPDPDDELYEELRRLQDTRRH